MGNICFCDDIEELFRRMKQPFDKREWRLFIDGSKRSVKFVLLHNGNEKPSIPIAYGIDIIEEYDMLSNILDLLLYQRYKFQIVADFKVVAVLMGLQSGYTKFSCHLCLWNSRSDNEHYTRVNWPPRTEFITGSYNVKKRPLVSQDSIILPPLHIKLGLMKNFVKALDRESEAFAYVRNFFPRISTEKIKQGIFNGPQIRELLLDDRFERNLNEIERAAWESFRKVVHGFLGNNRDSDYKEIVADLLRKYNAIGARLSLKMHFLKSHLDIFPENLGHFSDEHGEKFHQDLMEIENRFAGKFKNQMLGEYCWSLLRNRNVQHNRQGTNRHF